MILGKCVYIPSCPSFLFEESPPFFLPRAEVCFEQVDEIDTGDFKYVGAGHGTYEQVTFIPEAQTPGLGGGVLFSWAVFLFGRNHFELNWSLKKNRNCLKLS